MNSQSLDKNKASGVCSTLASMVLQIFIMSYVYNVGSHTQLLVLPQEVYHRELAMPRC